MEPSKRKKCRSAFEAEKTPDSLNARPRNRTLFKLQLVIARPFHLDTLKRAQRTQQRREKSDIDFPPSQSFGGAGLIGAISPLTTPFAFVARLNTVSPQAIYNSPKSFPQKQTSLTRFGVGMMKFTRPA